jgi:hypothetical protein
MTKNSAPAKVPHKSVPKGIIARFLPTRQASFVERSEPVGSTGTHGVKRTKNNLDRCGSGAGPSRFFLPLDTAPHRRKCGR